MTKSTTVTKVEVRRQIMLAHRYLLRGIFNSREGFLNDRNWQSRGIDDFRAEMLKRLEKMK